MSARRAGLSRARTCCASRRKPCIRAALSRGSAALPKSSDSSPAPRRLRRSIWKNLSWACSQPIARATSIRLEPSTVGTPSASREILTGEARPGSGVEPGRLGGVQGESVRRLLKGFELGPEQRLPHVMADAPGEAAPYEGEIPAQVDVPAVRRVGRERAPERLLQGGACDHGLCAPGGARLDVGADRSEPWRAVGVVEGNARGHLGDVGGGMKGVGVAELPAKGP